MKLVKVYTDDLMSIQDAAKELGHARYTIYRWIESGKIIGLRFGGILYVPTCEVDRLKKDGGGVSNE